MSRRRPEHIPLAGGDFLCGETAITAGCDVCGRCLRRLARILRVLSDEQLDMLGLARAAEEHPDIIAADGSRIVD